MRQRCEEGRQLEGEHAADQRPPGDRTDDAVDGDVVAMAPKQVLQRPDGMIPVALADEGPRTDGGGGHRCSSLQMASRSGRTSGRWLIRRFCPIPHHDPLAEGHWAMPLTTGQQTDSLGPDSGPVYRMEGAVARATCRAYAEPASTGRSLLVLAERSSRWTIAQGLRPAGCRGAAGAHGRRARPPCAATR